MTTDPIIVIQTQPDMPPGLLAAWGRATAQPLDVRRVDLGDALPEPGGSVVILGSDASVHDRSVPWLSNVHDWTADLLAADIPVLGISFGAQLIAHLLDADVIEAPAGRPRWTTVDSTEPWLPAGPWLSWHHRTIRPTDALDVVARDGDGVQAFTAGAGGRHLGLQFRPEATTATIDAWAAAAGMATAADRTRLDAATARHCAIATSNARAVFTRWAQVAAQPASERLSIAA
jgi:GMP synthase-like glutamine amidotransferase